MRPADKGRDILAEAECYHVTRNVAFTRAWAYHDSRDKVIATAAGTFALNDITRWASGNEAMDMANNRMMQAVPDADVIVNNPTHISVAIRYRQGEDGAPGLAPPHLGRGRDGRTQYGFAF